MRNNQQSKLILLSWLVYTSAYVGRYSYNSNIVSMEGSLGLSHAETGLVATIFFFIYGAGQFLHGTLCKKYPKKYTVPAALFISAVVNFLVFVNIPFATLKYLWAINAAVQSSFWSSLMCILGENLNDEYIGKSVIPMSTPAAVGTFVVYGLSALCAVWGGYRYAYLTASLLMTVVAVWWMLAYDRMTEKKSIVLQPENQKVFPASSDEAKASLKKGVRSLFLGIAELAVFSVCNNLIKDGLTTWVPSILKEKYGLSDSWSIALSLMLPILGLFGAILVTRLNKLTNNYVYLTGGLFLCSSTLIFSIIGLLSTSLWTITLVMFGLTSLLMYGINNVITCLGPLYMRSQINAGILAGILNGFAYVGSTISSYSLGVISDKNGWNDVIRFLLVICLIPVGITTLNLTYDIVKKSRETLI